MFPWLARRVWPLLKTTLQGWSKDDGAMLSAAMAYYAAFSFFPLCLVLIAILGLVTRFSAQVQDQQTQMIKLVQENVDPWLASQLRELLSGVQSQVGLGGPIGLFTLMIGAIGIFMQLETMFDRIWAMPETDHKGWLHAIREAIWDRIVAFVMLLGVGALLMLLFLAGMVPSGIRGYVVGLPAGRYAWQTAQLAALIAAYTFLLGIVYKTIPKARVPWRAALGGGLLVAIIWQLGQQVLVFFLIGEKYSAYGVVGSFIAVMIWFYYASAVVFLGAEFVAAICRQDDRTMER